MMNANFSGKTSRFKLIKIYDRITSETLKQEIVRRKLSYELVNEYLYQAFILDRKSQRKSICFAFPNAKDHYEITIPYPARGQNFKSSITQNTFTLIEGEQSNHVEIFSDVWDYLTWLTMMKCTVNKYDAFILNGRNSTSLVANIICDKVAKVKSIMDFTNNADGSDKIRETFADLAEEHNLRYGEQNYIFRNFENLNDYWVCNPEIHDQWPPR